MEQSSIGVGFPKRLCKLLHWGIQELAGESPEQHGLTKELPPLWAGYWTKDLQVLGTVVWR